MSGAPPAAAVSRAQAAGDLSPRCTSATQACVNAQSVRNVRMKMYARPMYMHGECTAILSLYEHGERATKHVTKEIWRLAGRALGVWQPTVERTCVARKEGLSAARSPGGGCAQAASAAPYPAALCHHHHVTTTRLLRCILAILSAHSVAGISGKAFGVARMYGELPSAGS